MSQFLPAMCVWILGAAGVCGAAQPSAGRAALQAPRFVLLLPGKAPEPVALLSIGPDDKSGSSRVVYLGSGGARTSLALDSIVAIAPDAWMPTPEHTSPVSTRNTGGPLQHRLWLTDGQRIIGELLENDPAQGQDGEGRVRVRHERLGDFDFPIDRVRQYEDDVDARVRPIKPVSTAADTVLLANGDVIEGFVATLGPTVVIEPAGGASPGGGRSPATRTSIDQVTLVHLVNPPQAPTGSRLELADGTVLAASNIAAQLESAKISFTPLLRPKADGPATLDLSELASLVPSAARISALALMPIADQRTERSRAAQARAMVLENAPAPLGAADILIPTPMSVEWVIPAGMTSITGYAQMDDRSFTWGDCVVTVSVVGRSPAAERTLATGRVNAQAPTLTIATDLGEVRAGDRLRVRVDSGEYGPVQDRIVLRRMLMMGGTN